MQFLYSHARFEAQFIDEVAPPHAETLGRLGPETGAVLGEHEVVPELFVQRGTVRNRGQLGDDVLVVPQGEFHLGPGLVGRVAPLVEPGRLVLDRPPGDPREGGAFPQVERLPVQDTALFVAALLDVCGGLGDE